MGRAGLETATLAAANDSGRIAWGGRRRTRGVPLPHVSLPKGRGAIRGIAGTCPSRWTASHTGCTTGDQPGRLMDAVAAGAGDYAQQGTRREPSRLVNANLASHYVGGVVPCVGILTAALLDTQGDGVQNPSHGSGAVPVREKAAISTKGGGLAWRSSFRLASVLCSALHSSRVRP